MTLHEELVGIGAEIDHHESDLYVRATPRVREIILRHVAAGTCAQSHYFTSGGELWFEVPFAFQPWWKEHAS